VYVRHHIVPALLLFRGRHCVVNVLEIGFHLGQLLVSDGQAKLLLLVARVEESDDLVLVLEASRMCALEISNGHRASYAIMCDIR
jgi:hypothetical protein